MPKYIQQLRRGWKDDTTGRDDWRTYETLVDHIKPLEGEPVLEYDNGIPRLKLGDGINEFSDLPYISIDSFLLPKPISVTLYNDKWEQVFVNNDAVVNVYSQVVTVDNAIITANSKVDLQPNTEQLCDICSSGITLTVENDGGVITVYTMGGKPAKTCVMQATVTEILLNTEVSASE